jgi:glycosyltransferase involved in cell wall biosynthesis
MNRITARLAKVDYIVCVSNATKRDLLSYVNIFEERVSVIHNAVFQRMEPASDAACAELRGRLDLPAEAPLILHVGRNWYKNRETVLDVAARVRAERPEVHLVMVGALTPALADRAKRLGLGEALRVVERVSAEDMPILYSTAAVLLFPSHYEGFGLPVLEAQLCGTPVVCSDRGALPEVAIDALMFSPEATESLAKGVISALQKKRQSQSAIASRAGKMGFDQEFWCDAHKKVHNSFELSEFAERKVK